VTAEERLDEVQAGGEQEQSAISRSGAVLQTCGDPPCIAVQFAVRKPLSFLSTVIQEREGVALRLPFGSRTQEIDQGRTEGRNPLRLIEVTGRTAQILVEDAHQQATYPDVA
jgi:hypothetical protein